jgi:hypothetical protein
MKKLLLLLLAAAVSFNLCAEPWLHRRPPQRIRRTHPVKVCRKPKIQYPPWKVVAAGGAAAGTVIASYKVSNGLEEGIKTVAKEHPEEFSNSLSVLTGPLRWGLLILMCVSGWWLWRKYLGNKNNERKETPNADRSVEE